MSNWILCLFVSIIFCCLDETVEAPAKKMKKPPPGDRSFFVTIRIHHKVKENAKKKSSGCSGTLIDVDTVLTAASCFMQRSSGKKLEKLDSFSKTLDLDGVYIYTGDLRNSSQETASIEVKEAHLYWNAKGGPSLSHGRYDVAKLKLKARTDSPAFIMLMERKKAELPFPLRTCGPDDWTTSDHVSIAGFSWLYYKIEDLNDELGHYRGSWTCMEWHESEMKVSDTENMCKGIFKKEPNNENANAKSFCAVGVVSELAPEVAEDSIREMRTTAYSSYTNIQENRGGPVFSTDSEGNAKCLVGVLNGIPTDDKTRYVKTKDDWFKGAIFSSVEKLDSLTLFKEIVILKK